MEEAEIRTMRPRANSMRTEIGLYEEFIGAYFLARNKPFGIRPQRKEVRMSDQASYQFKNTNTWSTRQLVTMALLCAIGVLLSFIEFPLLPGVPWLMYDASAMPAMVCGFAFGPAAGFAVGLVGAVLHGILFADVSGAFMNILVVAGLVLPAAFVYRKMHTMKGAIIGLVLSVIAATIMAILGDRKSVV